MLNTSQMTILGTILPGKKMEAMLYIMCRMFLLTMSMLLEVVSPDLSTRTANTIIFLPPLQ